MAKERITNRECATRHVIMWAEDQLTKPEKVIITNETA